MGVLWKVKWKEGSVHQSNMYVQTITWISVTLAARLCHSLNEHPPLYKGVTEKTTCLEDQFHCVNQVRASTMCMCLSKPLDSDGNCDCSICNVDLETCRQKEKKLLDNIRKVYGQVNGHYPLIATSTCIADQFHCFHRETRDCLPKSRVCDGKCDCNNCEDEPSRCWKTEEYFIKDHFWTFFFIAVVLSIWCLVDKKKDISPSEDVEQSQQPQNNVTSASQQLPSYYLHTLHRPQSPLPVIEIQRRISGTTSNALATNSSNESDQINLPPPAYEDANLPPSYEEVVQSHHNGSIRVQIDEIGAEIKESQL